MPKPAPVRGPKAMAEIGNDLVHRPDIVYAEATARHRHLDDLRAAHERLAAIPSVDLDTAAAEVSVEFPPLDSIVVAVVHLVITHELPDCWSAPEDDLEKLWYIHHLLHIARDQDHHHGDEPVRQPAHIRELQPRSKDGKFASSGHGNGAGA